MKRVDAGDVHARMAKHYPKRVLKWISGMKWTAQQVPLSKIHMQPRPGHPIDEAKVAAIRKGIRAGKPQKPVMLVNTGRGKHKIADGYHRLEADRREGVMTHAALVGRTSKRSGPWSRAVHDAKLNT